MASKTFLRGLFESHLADLKSVFPDVEDIFICPICLRPFSVEDIDNGDLTDGHVWPEYLREKSNGEESKIQRVLLCQSCNSRAGGHGDAQVEVLDRVKGGERTGELYGERRVQILFDPNEKPIELRAEIVRLQPDVPKAQLRFQLDLKRNQWIRNSPEEQKRFHFHLGQEERFSLIIHPYENLKPALAEVGWLTSAYLLAFYTFGYGYILLEDLNPVRRYILRSFEGDNTRLELEKSETLAVWVCSTCYYHDPEIRLFIPLDGKTPFYLQVAFLDYHVRLPIQCASSVLTEIICMQHPDIAKRLPELVEKGAVLDAPIRCHKADTHICIWDYVLGKPLPKSESSSG